MNLSAFNLLILIAILVVSTFSLDDRLKIDCIPENVQNLDEIKYKCNQRKCIYEESIGESVPWCYYPSNYGYKLKNDPQETDQGYKIELVRDTNLGSTFGHDIVELNMDIEFQLDQRLRIKIYDPKNPKI